MCNIYNFAYELCTVGILVIIVNTYSCYKLHVWFIHKQNVWLFVPPQSAMKCSICETRTRHWNSNKPTFRPGTSTSEHSLHSCLAQLQLCLWLPVPQESLGPQSTNTALKHWTDKVWSVRVFEFITTFAFNILYTN